MELPEQDRQAFIDAARRRTQPQEGGAAFGVYPSSGKRPEKLNVSRDVNMPAQTARGWVAGTLGLPGDIEGLGRLLVNMAPAGQEHERVTGKSFVGETPVLPTSDFYREWLPGGDERPAAQFASGLGALAGGAGSTKVAGAAVKGAKATGRALGPKAAEMAEGYLQKSGLAPSVVKPKGGNWLSGSVETATKPLKGGMVAGQTPAERIPLHEELLRDPTLNADQLDRVRYQLEATRGEDAINNWVDKKLNRYIKNEMGTPEDPVRKLAERGVTHMQNQPTPEPRGWVEVYRQDAGYPREGLGQTPLAKGWENIADEMIAAQSAGRLRGALSEFEGAKTTTDLQAGVNRTLVKERAKQLEDAFKDTPSKDLADEFNLDYEVTDANRAQTIEDWARTEVEGYYSGNAEDMLGPHYSHKVGLEGKDAADRGEDLSWLSKIPEDQPVYATVPTEGASPEFSHLIDELRNATRADSDLPANLRWKPEDLQKVTMEQAVERVSKINDWRAAQMEVARKAAREGIPIHKEYEGGFQWMAAPDTAIDPKSLQYIKDVGCEGGWCTQGEDLAKKYGGGGNQLYVLHGPDGKPVVQISVRPGKAWNERSGAFYANPELEDSWRQFAIEASAAEKGNRPTNYITRYPEWLSKNQPELYKKYEQVFQTDPPEIVEIKGKQNSAPKEEHLPMVQDFVRSGQWSRVGDIQNTGMRAARSVFNDAELQRLRDAGETNIPYILSGEDIQRLHNLITPEGRRLKYDAKGNIVGSEEPGYAKGGLVQDTDAIVFQLKGMDKDKALTHALRMANAKQEAHMAAGGLAKLLKGAKKAEDAAKVAKPAEKVAEAATPAVKGPQAKALETARKNAVKMLGLPETNTPQDRAKALGFTDYLHGTQRMDRLLEKKSLDPRRATSGPMPFGTPTPELASSYAMQKVDTSLRAADEGDVTKYFEVAPKDIGLKGMKTPLPVEKAWYFMSPEQRAEIAKLAPRVGYENLDEFTGKFIVHPEGVNATLSPSQWDWIMKREAKGNPLAALREMWHESGQLVDEPEQLGEIYRLAGVKAPISQLNAPWTEAKGVLLGKARITNPLDTANTEQVSSIIDPLKQAFARDKSRTSHGPDQWAKQSRYTPKEWVAELERDLAQGKDSYVWTSIPDKVTEELKRLNFNGIIDRSGKGVGAKEPVVIPFEPEQVRSRFAAFDPARVNEKDLLGAADPALLAGTAVASGIGLGALGQMSKPKPEQEEKKKAAGGLAKRM